MSFRMEINRPLSLITLAKSHLFVQKKVNEIVIKHSPENISHKNVLIIESDEGVYVEFETIIGKDNEGEDLKEPNLIMYPWENVFHIKWNEPTLIAAVKESVFSNMYEELEDFIDSLSEEEEEEVEASTSAEKSNIDSRDTPGFNPYDKKD